MAVKLTQEMITGAQETERKYGVPASVTLAQIMQESGGKYSGGLSGLAYNYNNLFGIKAGSSWTGDTVSLSTTEVSNGTPYTTTAKFRVYSSIADSIDDHGKLLTKSIYTDKTSSATTLNEYVKAMGSVYATDPDYADKLLKIINDNNLTKYDSGEYTFTGDPNYVNDNTSGGTNVGWFGKMWDSLLSVLVKILAISLFLILGVVFFMSAFDLKVPTKKNVKETVNKSNKKNQT